MPTQLKIGGIPFTAAQHKDVLKKTIPEGKYTAILTKAEPIVTPDGKEQLKLAFKIVAGQFNGKMIFTKLYTNGYADGALEKADFVLTGLMYAAGAENSPIIDAAFNKPVVITVSVDEFNGEEFNRVNKVTKLDAEDSVPTVQSNFTNA